MYDTEEQSAIFKQRLKHEPVTDELRALAKQHPEEADEAFNEVKAEHEWPTPGSWVWEQATNPNYSQE